MEASGPATEVAQEAVDTSALTCRHCHEPMPPPKRKGLVKEFCSDRHRAAFAEAQRQAAVAEVRRVVVDCQASMATALAELEQHQARLDAALGLLDRLTRKPRPRARTWVEVPMPDPASYYGPGDGEK